MRDSYSNFLFDTIKAKVFKEDEIQRVSRNSSGSEVKWIFDFKSQALSKSFLEAYSSLFWERFQSFNDGNIQVGGMETGAIPLIAGISLFVPEKKALSSFYIRKSRKKSDLANLIEGEIDPSTPVVLVDDILNTGSTLKKMVMILEEKGLKVKAIFVCLRFRDMSDYKELLDKGIRIESIFELNDFRDVLPVKNFSTEKSRRYKEYGVEYKITLTDAPNLYAVVPKSGPVLVGEFVYMGADDGTFFCLRASDGSIVWTHKVLFGSHGKKIFSTCVVYKNSVLFGAYDGNVYCLDRFTGKVQWVFFDADWVGSSPSVNEREGVVYVGLEFGLFKKHGGLCALDIATGKTLWKNYSMEGLTHASPTYSSKHNIVVCGCNDGYVYAFNAKSGEIVWKFKTEADIKYGALFDDKRDLVIIGGLDKRLYVLNSKDGSLFHAFEARFGFYSTPVQFKHLIVIGSLDKIIYCFNLDTKSIEWTFETSGRIFASPVLDKEIIFIGSNDGALYELNVLTGKLISKTQFSERIVNKVCIESSSSKRVIFVPTHVCELYKIKEKEAF